MPRLNESLEKSKALADAPTLGNLHPDSRTQAIARASQAEGERIAARLRWLHRVAACDVDGYEWGIFRVKWVNGRAVEVWQTNGDFSDLDAAMALSHEAPELDKTKAIAQQVSDDGWIVDCPYCTRTLHLIHAAEPSVGLPDAADAGSDDARDAKRYRWLMKNMTFYDTAESYAPVLASVSARIWYHATDDTAYPLTAVIDVAMKDQT